MTKNKKGFTIIEVVLVLAIAGLIFLMVFIALPALQRSQRNTQREDDISRFLTAANDYQTNNNGKTPFGNGTNRANDVDKRFVKRYIDDSCSAKAGAATVDGWSFDSTYECNGGSQFTDPDGTVYNMKHVGAIDGSSLKAGEITVKVTSGGASTDQDPKWPNAHAVLVYTNASCGDEGTTVQGNGKRQYAMFYVLEGDSITCNDNH